MEKIILGIDPGTTILGYGLLKISGKSVELLTLGVVNLSKFEDHYLKLQKIYTRLDSIIKEFCPDEMALEAPFFGKNVQSMLKLGRAQGVAMAVGLNHEMPISEYAPRKVKMSITGSGAASKEQVATMISKLLKIDEMPDFLDATDAVAVALCHHYESQNPFACAAKGGNSWKNFIEKNPNRVKK
ncbi:MAG: crossover junction endodeoxyribonuclease RuvC [Bacteroidales bacterium]|jgi:crossover junction endodeoxyribonuclease RuvC|nr:crossover junction endodeoxyribonuclease RuvC [Bacteroidales bacterium]